MTAAAMGQVKKNSTPSHKEKGEKWMEFGSDGHQCISHELSRLSHPLKTKNHHTPTTLLMVLLLTLKLG